MLTDLYLSGNAISFTGGPLERKSSFRVRLAMTADDEHITNVRILSDVKSFFLQDATVARERIATLDEQSLRDLRDQLHVKLMDELPAIAGRQLTKRMPGNVAKLADDCWAFGASLAQEALLKEADHVLKPPDRRIPATVTRSCSATQTASSDQNANLESILRNMLRIDREVKELRASDTRMKAILAAQQVRLTNLEERAARCAARDECPSNGETRPVSPASPATADAADCAATAAVNTVGPPQDAASTDPFSAPAELIPSSRKCPSTGESEGSTASPTRSGSADTEVRDVTPQTEPPVETSPPQVEPSNDTAARGSAVQAVNAATDQFGDAPAVTTSCASISPAGVEPAPCSEGRCPDKGSNGQADSTEITASLTAKLARTLDLNQLAGAIVARMKAPAVSQRSEGEDSDSEPDQKPTESRQPGHLRTEKHPQPPALPPAGQNTFQSDPSP